MPTSKGEVPQGYIETPIGVVRPPRFRLEAEHIDRIKRLKRNNMGVLVEQPVAYHIRSDTEQQLRTAFAEKQEWEQARTGNPFFDYGYCPAFDPYVPEKPETHLLAYRRALAIVNADFFWLQLHPEIIEEMNLFCCDPSEHCIIPVVPECTNALNELLLASACNLVTYYAYEKHLDRFKRHTLPNTAELTKTSLSLFHRKEGVRLMGPVLEQFGAEPDTLDFYLGTTR